MSYTKRLIDANVFENDIQKMFVPYGDGTYLSDKNAMIYDEALVDVLEVLNKAHTVDAVEVVHGRWIHKGAWHIECSECNYILAHIGEAKNYCPNCGAKMDGGNEDV